MASNFVVYGPFTVPITKRAAARFVGKDNVDEFWEINRRFADEKGCYIFAIKAAKGSKPVYVGKSTKGFEEAFAPHKLNKLHEALADQRRGKLIIYFVCLERARGKTNKVAVDNAESFLIQLALQANPRLSNKRKVKVETWSIAGIVRSPKGARSKSAGKLRKCLKLD